MNIIKLLTLSFILLLSSVSLADKPAWAGKGKPSAEQKEVHKKAMNSKEDDSDDKEKKSKDKKSKKEKSRNHENDKGDDDDKEKNSKNMKTKSIDDMKEIDKGIEQREEKRKKWWSIFS